MPIRRDLRHHYGPIWRALARELKHAAGHRCQGCGRAQGEWVYRARLSDLGQYLFDLLELAEGGGSLKYQVVLTVAHLNHNPADNRRDNLRVLCQACHLRHDLAHHVANAAATRARQAIEAARRAGQLQLI